jgi:hypothetical protein
MRKKGAGRPPLPEGKRVDDLPKISVQMRPEIRKVLDAIVTVLQSAAYKVIENGLLSLCAGMTPETRERVEAELKGTKLPEPTIVSMDVPAERVESVRAFLDLLEHPKSEMQEALARFIVKSLKIGRGATDVEGNGHE